MTIISSLYQRTLNQALSRLNIAQQQLVRSRLLQREMEIAREVQQKLYPEPPDLAPYVSIAARSEPALETSGDFYDFIRFNDHQVGIVVADVAGKSISAAMIMTMTRSVLRSEIRETASPARVLEQANRVLYEDRSINQMVTAFYGLLDTRNMTFCFANAGHIFPTLKHEGQVREYELPGIPLGLIPDPKYQEQRLDLEPGDQLILSSDGFVETMNEDGELFGFDRFLETVRQTNGHHPQQALLDIWQTIDTFRGQGEQQDDMTLVIIEVNRLAEG